MKGCYTNNETDKRPSPNLFLKKKYFQVLLDLSGLGPGGFR